MISPTAIPKLEIPEHLAGRSAFRVRDLVDSFGLSKAKVFQLIKSGRLDAVKLDGVVLIPRAAVETYLETAVPIRGNT